MNVIKNNKAPTITRIFLFMKKLKSKSVLSERRKSWSRKGEVGPASKTTGFLFKEVNMKYKTWEEWDEEKRINRAKGFLGAFLVSSIFWGAFIILMFTGISRAECITDEKAVQCLLGEARGDGYASLLGHAEAIRNRGHLRGVYGCSVKVSKAEIAYLEKKGILKQAFMAWEASKTTNTVKGASFWGSLKVDGAWIKKMEQSGFKRTAVINNTAFYRKDSKHGKS